MNYYGHALQKSKLSLTTTTPMAPRTRITLPKKSRARGRAGVPGPAVASGRAPLLEMPAEIALEIMELALINTRMSTLAIVSKKFSALVSNIIYKTVVLRSLEAITLFHRTVRSKAPGFLYAHVRALTVCAPYYDSMARAQLEEIVAACSGVRTLAIPRPGILASPLISWTIPSDTSFELILEAFDAVTPFMWDPLFDVAAASPAAHLCARLTHLRICQPTTLWHSPLETLAFFGPLPRLTHLALARALCRQDALSHPNDGAFLAEVRALLARRPPLRMLVVSLFPARWPKPTRAACSLCHPACLCRALGDLARADRRLVLLTVGWDTLVEEDPLGNPDFEGTAPPYANHGGGRPGCVSFWDNWRMSDKRTVSLATGWEPEILPDAVEWSYAAVPDQLRGRHNFWEHWLVPE
ncbi:hypothetical protein B0H17DRAFT_1071863 [Mycena rosella]|uniref:F-box domain-containing protein n=1 Tax=Mycena rosella TaxID=1033263 RepID=A0AAD7DD55_MYCRO|nr:hypothetical protein B0H17DRAFT_1071863 [Mycena rosella]